jgi:hypothetical protein
MTGFLGDLGLSVIVSSPLALAGLSGPNLVSNSGFETAGGGDPDIFASWTEFEDSGNADIAQDSTNYYEGSKSCRIDTVAGEGAGVGYVSQDFSVEAGEVYELTLRSLVSDSIFPTQGRYAVYDVTNAAWITTIRGTGAFSSVEWLLISDIFRIPIGCSTARLYLYQNIYTGESVYYDSVNIQKRENKPSYPIPQWTGVGGISSYMHTISANIGFDTMAMNSAGDLAFVGAWIDKGLGNHVTVKDNASHIIWEGFINQISANIGGLTITIGPLMDTVNRGRIVYATVDWDTTPPVKGVTVRGEWQDNFDSQEKFGILSGIVTGGEGDATEMSQLLSSILAHTSWPETTQNFSLSAATDMRVTISCLGYGHLFKKYFYYETSVAGSVNVSTKLASVINTDPNNMFSDTNADIETNTTQIHQYESDDKTALALIKEMVAMGDDEYNRYTFGVYGDQKIEYAKVLDTPTYFQSMETGETLDGSNVSVHPWAIRPGVWMVMTDIVLGKPLIVENFKSDPRYIFIESITYNAPYAFTVSGGRVSKFKQRIEKLGLGGI